MAATRVGLKTAEEAWAFLTREAGLDVHGYDEDLVNVLAATLAVSAPRWTAVNHFPRT